MDASKIRQLYQQVILEHDRRPVHFEKRPEASVIIEAYNPFCGDRFTLYLDLEEDIVTRASFHGYGCAISKAAASILVERMAGKSKEDLLALCNRYLALLDPKSPELEIKDRELAAFMGARQFPARRQCASLSWEELKRYLEAVE